jgi:predicted lipoprotein with Yx(FWY)xxD motif
MLYRTLVVSGAAVLTLVAACSSSSNGNGSGGTTTTQPPASSVPAAAAANVTISVDGTTLIGPNGHTLYANTADSSSKIVCTETCATDWPPVIGSPKAGSGVSASRLGTATRPDGKTQATYDGRPLYEFAKDSVPGDMTGEGFSDLGGTWHVVTVSGAPASESSSPDDSGGASSPEDSGDPSSPEDSGTPPPSSGDSSY